MNIFGLYTTNRYQYIYNICSNTEKLIDRVFSQYIKFGYSEFKDPFVFCFIPGKVTLIIIIYRE